MKCKVNYGSLFLISFLLLAGIIIIAVVSDKSVATISERMITDSRRCLVIDAGHGGVDGGATSCTGALESNLNLEIALKLQALAGLLGMKTSMIRTTDCSVYTSGKSIAAQKVSDLKNRVKIVNETENALLISIHQNYYSEDRYSGAQVFYPKTVGSEILAKQLQTTFVNTINRGSKRKAKPATGIYLMNNINCTGVLIECGFLSNPQEEKQLRDPEYQNKICCVIAATLTQYLYNSAA